MHLTYGKSESEAAVEEIDRAHQEFLAQIVHLDGKTAQRLFEKISRTPDDIPIAGAADHHEDESTW